MRRIEQGQIGAVDAIDVLLFEELTQCHYRRVKPGLVTARTTSVKTLYGFASQP